MKAILTLALTCIVISFSFAQDIHTPLLKKKKSRIVSFGLRSQVIVSDYSELSHDDIINMAKDPKQVAYDMDTYMITEQYTSESLNIGAFARINQGQLASLDMELEIGIDYYAFSEVLVDYKEEDTPYMPYLGWCLMQNRFDLQAAYWFVTNRDKKWDIRFGPSITGGRSLNERVLIFDEEYSLESPVETIDARSTSFISGFANLEAQRTIFNVLNLGFGLKFGKGVQIKENNRITSFGIYTSLAYKFR